MSAPFVWCMTVALIAAGAAIVTLAYDMQRANRVAGCVSICSSLAGVIALLWSFAP